MQGPSVGKGKQQSTVVVKRPKSGVHLLELKLTFATYLLNGFEQIVVAVVFT